MKKMIIVGSLTIFLTIVFAGCKKREPIPPPAKMFSADVANEWMKLNMRLTMTTPGFNSVVGGRSFAYVGLTLYESVVPGIKTGHSIATQLGGGNALKALLPYSEKNSIYVPASANAAMATLTKALFGNTSAANVQAIDSLEAAFKAKFVSRTSPAQLEASYSFGNKVAKAIFEWSKTDGGHEAYLHVTDPSYVPPAGPGKWIPTPPAFSAPIHPGWGSNRSFISGIASATLAPTPLTYSEDSNSPYYQQPLELYNISLSLKPVDSTTVRFWADLPVNYNVPAHATGILCQLIELKKLDLTEAAVAYAKHSMAMNDALISVFKSKYLYNCIRPVSVIRSVFNKPQWNTVIPTPPHPEYPAAHGAVSGASADVLEGIFGKHFAFSDYTYEKLYGVRSWNSFEDYAQEAGLSRVLGGIHYRKSVNIGLEQGRKVGDAVNQLDFGGK